MSLRGILLLCEEVKETPINTHIGYGGGRR